MPNLMYTKNIENYATANAPSFTCTFCHCITLGRPEVLGRSARLACYPCSSALLDLSICWVCGEMIVRGEECVSFGWCFWHRACYGCLLYGNRTVRRPESDADRAGSRGSGRDDGEEGGTRLGQEVYEPPLCVHCETDTVVSGSSLDDIVDAGLTHVESVDGGVTRQRWRKRQHLDKTVQKTGIRIM